jgi:hypothetical protein
MEKNPDGSLTVTCPLFLFNRWISDRGFSEPSSMISPVNSINPSIVPYWAKEGN